MPIILQDLPMLSISKDVTDNFSRLTDAVVEEILFQQEGTTRASKLFNTLRGWWNYTALLRSIEAVEYMDSPTREVRGFVDVVLRDVVLRVFIGGPYRGPIWCPLGALTTTSPRTIITKPREVSTFASEHAKYQAKVSSPFARECLNLLKLYA